MEKNKRKVRVMSQQDNPKKDSESAKIETENYITGGTFGPGSHFGREGEIKAEIIAETVNQVSGGVDANKLKEFLALLEQIKSQAVNLPGINEYESKDLERSLELVEDHASRPSDARDSNLLMQALDKVRNILAKVVPVATLATQLWEMGKQLFGR